MSYSCILKKLYFNNKSTSHYGFFKSNSFSANLISSFFTDSYDGIVMRRLLQDEKCSGVSGNMISWEKRGDLVVFSNNYDESDPQFEFAISRETFSKILDEWENALNQKKEYIIIEVFDGNARIYATDTLQN